ncbi:MAG: alpha/beta hydrolase [Saprospiraceae bacterium]|nr:alpha/beta hydrolase [Saprospiraceae bacterium]
MKKMTIWLLGCLLMVLGINAQEITIDGIKGTRAYLEVPDAKINYEVFGEGEPLLILHGNGGSASSRHKMVSLLVDDFQVILMDSRCHGRSTCPSTELTYQAMAEDVNALMEHLGHDNYRIWGHSDGGILGLILGYRFPSRINSMLISGANLRPDSTALHPELVTFVGRYDEIEDPTMRKQIKLMAFHPNIPIQKMKEVKVPVVLMVGDRDAVTIEHTLEIFNALPQANLCMLPGTSHFIANERLDQLIYWIKQLKQPFRSPDTISIAKEVAKMLFKK